MPSSSSDFTTAIIIALSVGIVVCFIVCICFGLCWIIQRNKKKSKRGFEIEESNKSGPEKEGKIKRIPLVATPRDVEELFKVHVQMKAILRTQLEDERHKLKILEMEFEREKGVTLELGDKLKHVFKKEEEEKLMEERRQRTKQRTSNNNNNNNNNNVHINNSMTTTANSNNSFNFTEENTEVDDGEMEKSRKSIYEDQKKLKQELEQLKKQNEILRFVHNNEMLDLSEQTKKKKKLNE